MRRKTLNLSERDLARLAPYLERAAPAADVLAEFVGEEAPAYSESGALRALALAGAKAIEEEMMRRGYEAWASGHSDEDRAWNAAGLQLAVETWEE